MLAYLCYNTEQTKFDQMTSKDANFLLCYIDYCWKCPPSFCVHSAAPLKREFVSFWKFRHSPLCGQWTPWFAANVRTHSARSGV